MRNIKKILSKLNTYFSNNLWLISLLLTLLVITSGLLISLEGNKLITTNNVYVSHYYGENKSPIKFLANWDGADYIHIAKSGYDDKFYTGFFPLFSILIKFLHNFINSYVLCGVSISWLSLWGAIYFYMKFVRKFLEISNQKIRDNRELIKVVLYFILWPSGVYLFCVYTESLYAFFALASLYFALSRRINLATIFLFLAVIAHVTGFFLIPLIVLLLLEEKYSIIKSGVSGLVGSLGLLSYMTYLYVKFKDPLEFLNAQMMHQWLRNRIWNHFSSMSLLDFFIIVVLIITFFYWLKRRKSFSLYTLIFIAIPLFGGQFDGFARYSLMAFPSQLMIYEYLRNKNTLQIFSYISTAILWTYSVLLFAAGFVTH